MLQTRHAILIAFVSQMTYKGNWTTARSAGSLEFQAEPRRHPAEPYALREKGYCASKHPPPAIDRPRHAEPISEGGYIGAMSAP